jgi:hypothetical protein
MFSVSAEAGILAFREDNSGKAEVAVGEVGHVQKMGMTQCAIASFLSPTRHQCIACRQGFLLRLQGDPEDALTSSAFRRPFTGCKWSRCPSGSRSKKTFFQLLRICQAEPWISTQLIERQYRHSSSFYAVSYACGNEQPTSHIFCKGTAVAVTPHLQEAIRCIFNLYGRLDLFVDAICIDQQDGEERARQVANMHEVYSRAARVLVWLGHESRNGSAAMEYVRSLEYFLPEPS